MLDGYSGALGIQERLGHSTRSSDEEALVGRVVEDKIHALGGGTALLGKGWVF